MRSILIPVPILYLASTSPRRASLLTEHGLDFALLAPGPEETGQGAPRERAVLRARAKATGANPPAADALVLGVDTVVDIDGHELGKPIDRAAARDMLQRLMGRTHLVHTGHCLWRQAGEVRAEAVASALVRCDAIGVGELEAYLDGETWQGKAGAYGIQDPETSFLELVEGDVDTVIGLSMTTVRQLLRTLEKGGT